jgi:hypothetical protein
MDSAGPVRSAWADEVSSSYKRQSSLVPEFILIPIILKESGPVEIGRLPATSFRMTFKGIFHARIFVDI